MTRNLNLSFKKRSKLQRTVEVSPQYPNPRRFIPRMVSLKVNPIPGRGGGQGDPPSIFFNIAQKLLELLAYNFFTFPKYEFNMFS